MAITVSQGTNVTASTVALAQAFPTIGSYAYSQDVPGQSIFTNIANAVDQPNFIRTSVTEVADVFKKSSAVPVPGQSTAGVSVLNQLIETWKVADDGGGTFPPKAWYLPVNAYMVISMPIDVNITDAMMTALVARLAGASCRTAADTVGAQIRKIQRGLSRL